MVNIESPKVSFATKKWEGPSCTFCKVFWGGEENTLHHNPYPYSRKIPHRIHGTRTYIYLPIDAIKINHSWIGKYIRHGSYGLYRWVFLYFRYRKMFGDNLLSLDLIIAINHVSKSWDHPPSQHLRISILGTWVGSQVLNSLLNLLPAPRRLHRLFGTAFQDQGLQPAQRVSSGKRCRTHHFETISMKYSTGWFLEVISRSQTKQDSFATLLLRFAYYSLWTMVIYHGRIRKETP